MSSGRGGTFTFLFTDIEGSTRLWEDHPGVMGDALAWHDDVLARAVSGRGGHVVKTTGDGIHAVFAVAPDAIAAAVEAQSDFATRQWDGIGALLVRMGVHTGHADERAGDYYGSSVNRAARVAAAAHGGQILVTAAVATLAADALPPGAELVDLGEFDLRDLARPERLSMVTAPGLRSGFPAPRTLERFLGNLRPRLDAFFGRDDERATLVAALAAKRLVTLVGPGGVGKTRLATHVAADVLGRYPGGAWLCELAPIDDGERVADVLATTLRITRAPGTSLAESVVEGLRPRRALLVVDNCEHVVEAAAQIVQQVLRSCPEVAVLATSREPLDVEGEQVVRVEPLAVDSSSDPGGLPAAIALFVDRATGVDPGFELDAATEAAVGELCRRLDGLPLAIELAAARAAMLTPAEMSALLDERFRLLAAARRSGDPRHRALASTIEWSYAMLTPAERDVFVRLGVFHGSFDEAAATAVCAGAGVGRWEVREALAALVAKSMVATRRADGRTRYRLLESMRAFALERIVAVDLLSRLRRSHAEYYAGFAVEQGEALLGPDEIAAQTRIAEEVENLRAAVDWALQSGDGLDRGYGLTIIGALSDETMLRPALGVGEWAERALGGAGAETDDVPRVLCAAALALMWRGDVEQAAPLAGRVLDLVPDPAMPAHAFALNVAAIAKLLAGDVDAGRIAFRDALRALDDRSEQGAPGSRTSRWALSMWSAMWAGFAGDVVDARRHGERCLEIARASGCPTMVAGAAFAYAQSIADDEPERALAFLEEGAALTEAGAGEAVYGSTLGASAALLIRLGDPRRAVQRLQAAIAYLHRQGQTVMAADLLDVLAESCLRLDDAEGAATILGGRVHAAHPGHRSRLAHVDTDALQAELAVALPIDRFERAWRRGAGMSTDEVMVFAVEHADELLADVPPT